MDPQPHADRLARCIAVSRHRPHTMLRPRAQTVEAIATTRAVAAVDPDAGGVGEARSSRSLARRSRAIASGRPTCAADATTSRATARPGRPAPEVVATTLAW